MEVLQFVKNYKLKEATLTGLLFQKFNMAKRKNRKSRGYYSFGPGFFIASFPTRLQLNGCHAILSRNDEAPRVHGVGSLVDRFLLIYF